MLYLKSNTEEKYGNELVSEERVKEKTKTKKLDDVTSSLRRNSKVM